jgi:DNA-binding MarR family transcriptional regulator
MTGSDDDRDQYALELEQATRGLFAVTIAAIGQMEESINATHLRALQALDRMGRPCKVIELADALGLVSSSASRLSDRLTEVGMITRRQAPDNRRATQLELTERGRDTVRALLELRARAMREVTDLMPESARQDLLRGAREFTQTRQRLLAARDERDDTS